MDAFGLDAFRQFSLWQLKGDFPHLARFDVPFLEHMTSLYYV
jgi:hypothetical protein